MNMYLMSFHEDSIDLSIKHYVSQRVMTLGFATSTMFSTFSFETFFEVPRWVVGVIVPTYDGNVMGLEAGTPKHGITLIVTKY